MKKWKEILRDFLYSINIVFHADKVKLLVSILSQTVNTIFSLVLLYIGKCIINQIAFFLNNQFEFDIAILSISKWVILYFAISLCLIINNFSYEILLQKLQMKLGLYIDKEMSKKILELDISYFDSPDFYDQIAATLDSKNKMNFLIFRVTFGVANLLNILMSLSILFINNQMHLVMLLLLLVIPSLIISGKYVTNVFLYEDKNRKIIRKISYLSSLIYDKYTAKEIRFYNASDFIINKYNGYWNRYINGLKKIVHGQGKLDSGTSILPEIGIAFIMFSLIKSIIRKSLTIGDFTYLLGIFNSLNQGISSLIDDLSRLEESSLAIKYYKNFMSLNAKVSSEKGLELGKVISIEFDNVSFRYPNTEEYVLNGFSLTMQGDDKVAIVGANGAGKSTITKLLLRFYEPTSGEIRINGRRIQEYSISNIRKRFSVLFQDYIIYSFSMKRNVVISDIEKANDEELVWHVLRHSGLNELFSDDSITLETSIGKDFDDFGVELSGGTKQKIAMARAMFRHADCLIMDEPNAALDLVTEREIFNKIKYLYKGKGIIMVSHRLGNLDFFDCIYVIEHGKLVENGSQRELLKRRGRFYALFCSQKCEKWKSEYV